MLAGRAEQHGVGGEHVGGPGREGGAPHHLHAGDLRVARAGDGRVEQLRRGGRRGVVDDQEPGHRPATSSRSAAMRTAARARAAATSSSRRLDHLEVRLQLRLRCPTDGRPGVRRRGAAPARPGPGARSSSPRAGRRAAVRRPRRAPRAPSAPTPRRSRARRARGPARRAGRAGLRPAAFSVGGEVAGEHGRGDAVLVAHGVRVDAVAQRLLVAEHQPGAPPRTIHLNPVSVSA